MVPTYPVEYDGPAPGEVTITVEVSRRYSRRLRFAVWLIRVAARIARFDVELEDGTVKCEGCEVTLDAEKALRDADGVPLCGPCMKELAEEVDEGG